MRSQVLSLIILIGTLVFNASAFALTPVQLQQQIDRSNLNFYQKIGEALIRNLQKDLQSEGDIATQMESHYLSNLKLEKLSQQPKLLSRQSVTALIADVNLAVQLKQNLHKEFRSQAKIRNKIQNVFLGLMFSIETLSRVHLGQTLDELLTLDRYLMSKATFFATESNQGLNVQDVMFDFLWLRSLKFPVELTELSLKKIQALKNNANRLAQWSNLKRYAGSISLMALQRTQLSIYSPINTSTSFEKLIAVTKEIYINDPVTLREIKWLQYNYLQKVGRGSEAYDLKNSLYLDQLSAKAKLLVKEPVKIMRQPELGILNRMTATIASVVRNMFLVGKYSVGFLFVATPLEFLVLILALFILAHQGVQYFGESRPSFREIFIKHQILSKGGWRRLPNLLSAVSDQILWYAKLAWRMFVTTYTGAAVPFYSKLASSLLLFGVGLYFNSAKNLAETLLSLS